MPVDLLTLAAALLTGPKPRVIDVDDPLCDNPGELLGEMALFNKSRERTAGADCATDVQLGTLSVDKFWEVFAQDPAFGAFVLRTVVARNARRSVDQGDAVVAKA